MASIGDGDIHKYINKLEVQGTRRKAQGKRIDGLIQLLLPAHIEKRHVINPEESPFAEATSRQARLRSGEISSSLTAVAIASVSV